MTFSTIRNLTLAATIVAVGFPVYAQNANPGKGRGPGLAFDTTAPSAEEAKTLAFMREEEKLARDVYKQLAEKWNLTVFRNIAESEEQHFQAIGTMLAKYNLPDPALKDAGVYSDAQLTALYAELMTKGMASEKDALEVGVLIEKTDIADLEAAIEAAVKPTLKRLYTNLLAASYNHLEAFETNLESACPVCPRQ